MAGIAGAPRRDVLTTAGDSFVQRLARFGDFLRFSLNVITGLPLAVTRYRRESLRQLTDISWGSGALVVGGGTIGVMVLLAASTGSSLGIEGFNGLETTGLAPLVGFISATANTRELAPLVAALALGSQVGCRFTAQIGSMKIHEEVDALEVMAVDSLRFLASTRLVATMVAILPLYFVGLVGSYVASRMTVIVLFAQSPGQYDHYFDAFIQPRDVLFSIVKILIFSLVIGLIHCWFGFRVQAGPQQVGIATGRAIKTSIVVVVALDMVLTLLMWGSDPGFRLAG